MMAMLTKRRLSAQRLVAAFWDPAAFTMSEEYDGLRLHELVAKASWEEVLARLKTHPHEALHVVDSIEWLGRPMLVKFALVADDSNITALHLLCVQANSAPRQVIRAYLKAQPKAIKIFTSDNKSPLWLAVRANASAQKVAILASADPDAILLQDSHGTNVFHLLCYRTSPENVIQALMQVAGAQRTQQALLACDSRDNHAPIHFACSRISQIRLHDFLLVFQQTRIESLALNPLQELCTQYQANFLSCLRTAPIPTTAVSTEEPSPYCSPDRKLAIERFWMWRPTDALFLRRAWNMAFTLLGVTTESDLSTYPLLHECLERDVACTCDMFDYVLCLNPHYACQIRHDGLLPLHVLCRLAAQDGEQHWVERIRKLVRLYPKAASIPDPDGLLPLELLISPNITFEHASPVVEAFPSAVSRFDLPETWYPYVLSKLARQDSSNSIFQIIRDTPTLAAIR
jgi:hypothetical protein